MDTLVVDKTATLTVGAPTLTEVGTLEGMREEELLGLVAGLEAQSEHPLAAAIIQGSRERGIEPKSVEGFESVTGKGVVGNISGRRVALGNRAMMEQERLVIDSLRDHADGLRDEGIRPRPKIPSRRCFLPAAPLVHWRFAAVSRHRLARCAG